MMNTSFISKKFLNKFVFCSQSPILRLLNPYLALTPSQLSSTVLNYLQYNHSTPEHLNNLIKMGIAISYHPSLHQLNRQLTKKSMEALKNIQHRIQQQNEDQISNVDFGELTKLLKQNTTMKESKRNMSTLSSLYINTYSHLLPFPQQIKVFEYTQNSNIAYLEDMNQISSLKIHQYLQNADLNLRDFIAYFRLFSHKFTPHDLNNRLLWFLEKRKIMQLTQREKQTLAYFTIQTGGNYQIVQKMGLEPSLTVEEDDIPKSVCIKLEIRKYMCLLQCDLDPIKKNISRWDYDHIIWISEFLQKKNPIVQDLHSQFMKSSLPQDSDVLWTLTYASNLFSSSGQHQQLSMWLSCQSNLVSQKQKSLCSMLEKIHEEQWPDYYKQFYCKVLELSLGKFQWQTQNTVYYFGVVWKIEDENMEYLRRYILNTYASLGTARRQVPTSSYFYKILQVADVNKFYANL